MVTPSASPGAPGSSFDWPLAYDAEQRLSRFIEAFLLRNGFARKLAGRMRDETGTDFYEWVDHLVLAPEHGAELRAAGLVEAKVAAPAGVTVLYHPQAMMPRVLLRTGGSVGGVPAMLAVRPESLVDFIAAHDLGALPEGEFGARLRRALVAEENGTRFEAVERLGGRGFTVDAPAPGLAAAIVKARELFRARQRHFANDAEGVAHAFRALLDAAGIDPTSRAEELNIDAFRRLAVTWEGLAGSK